MKKKKGASPDAEDSEVNPYIFNLYIVGASPNSSRAVSNLNIFFEKYLGERYKLQIIDVYQQPQVAKSVDIVALPLLIRKFPLPEKRMIGDMSNSDKLLKSLDLIY
jgi:circadian clock protein KaiB